MPLILEQSFPLGRFHATRWNQNPFEDPYGEWPPSPWRLLAPSPHGGFNTVGKPEMVISHCVICCSPSSPAICRV